MAREDGRERLGDERILQHIAERPLRELADEPRAKLRILARLDEQHELERRMRQLDGGLRNRELRAVDHLSPLEKLRKRRRIPAEAIATGEGEKPRAALCRGIPEFLVARCLVERPLVLPSL